uniref:Uncharacterized protein n=1 Tax=Cacopsylla melanoneura TaxID=428564 RepID=A0A8D8Y464_9HEMI
MGCKKNNFSFYYYSSCIRAKKKKKIQIFFFFFYSRRRSTSVDTVWTKPKIQTIRSYTARRDGNGANNLVIEPGPSSTALIVTSEKKSIFVGWHSCRFADQGQGY